MGRIFKQQNAVFGKCRLHILPQLKVRFRYDIDLGTILVACRRTIEMLADAGAIIGQNVHRNGIGSQIDLDIIVISPLTFLEIPIVNVAVDQHAITVTDRLLAFEEFCKCGIPRRLSVRIQRRVLRFRR